MAAAGTRVPAFAAVPVSLTSGEAFLRTMAALSPEARQVEMNRLMRENAPALTNLIYGEGDRAIGYELEYDRALPENPVFFKNTFHGFANDINVYHDQSSSLRFSTANKFSAVRNYDVITQGWPELYTSTFNGLFDRYLQKARAEGVSLFTILDRYPGRDKKLTEFLEAVTTFERTGDLWASLKLSEKERLIDTLFDHVDRAESNRDIYALASFIKALPAQDPFHAQIQNKLMQGYQAHTGTQRDVYGVLSRWYIERQSRASILGAASFFATIRSAERYRMPDLARVEPSRLFDAQGRNNQLHMFYNEADGTNSHAGFISRMQGDGWSVQSPETGLKVLTKRSQGREIRIYAVMLEGSDDGKDAAMNARNESNIRLAKKVIAQEGGKASVVVHRGHSYLSPSSNTAIDDDTAIAFGGACGVTIYEEKIKLKHPRTHIAGTVGTGMGRINNSSIIEMNNAILRDGFMNWDVMYRFWQSGGPDMRQYHVPADSVVQNIAGALLRIKDGAVPAPSFDSPSPAP